MYLTTVLDVYIFSIYYGYMYLYFNEDLLHAPLPTWREK